jgi:hypothetical protein
MVLHIDLLGLMEVVASEGRYGTMAQSPFDAIRKVDENGNEYWSARDMACLLEYAQV